MVQFIEEVTIEMKLTRVLYVAIISCVMIFAATLNAVDTLNRFTQPTLDGKTITSETLRGMPLVINFSSPW